MVNLGEGDRYAPIAPGPIDSCRRRQHPIIIKRVQTTLPIKHKLTCNTQVYVVHPIHEILKITLRK